MMMGTVAAGGERKEGSGVSEGTVKSISAAATEPERGDGLFKEST